MSKNIAMRYAETLYEVLPKDKHKEVSQQLAQVSNSLGDPDVKAFFEHPRTSFERKQELISALKLEKTLESFLSLVIQKRRLPLLPNISQEFTKLVHEELKITTARITSVVPLLPENKEQLTKQLSQMTGKQVSIENKIDPGIWGGLVIELEGKKIDASLVNSFNKLKHNMLS